MSKLFQIYEDDLDELQSNLTLIYREGIKEELFNERQDLREAWEMIIKTLSDVRFNYGPPKQVEGSPI